MLEPTAANLEKMTQDLQKGLYSPAHINFLSSIPRPLLEEFATQTAQAGTSEYISQVFDQYLNFIVSEPSLFSLGMGKETYWTMNSAQTSDDDLDANIDRIVSGLFSVSVTMGTIPIIRCPKAGAAEMIAAKLDRKLRDHILNSKDNLFSASRAGASSTTSSRPVLIIVDRNVDLVPMLSHSWTYQSLIHDVLTMHLNRITLDTSEDGKPGAKRSYDLTTSDFFWKKNAGAPFPQVAEDLDADLKKYTDDAAEVTKKTGASSIEDLQNDTSSSAQHLKAAITLLPELRERKALLDMHMNIATELLKGIKDRQLDNFFQLEEDIKKQTKAQMLELLIDADKGNQPLDKLRLFIIWFLSTEQEVSRADMEKFEEALKQADIDTLPLAYIRRVREITRMTMISSAPISQPQQPSASNDLFRGFSSISSRLTDRLKDAGLGGANFDNLISGVKNLMPVNKDLTVTKITESLMDPQNASTSALQKTEGFLYFDPRSANARGTMPPSAKDSRSGTAPSRGIDPSFGQRRQGFSEAIVFTVGGGSMDEYGNLQEWAKRTSGAAGGAAGAVSRKRVIYGSTELVNAESFLNELARLGGEA
ncbi:Vesicle trafficking between the ER and Golgi [Recurvomyces mirabilis]|uniref:Vesicle trafficking between the ER and Golgi n=1 Tax=Recurvomyces mirabilis TaxID=574656 RepID=A0AAE0WW50_9PEZI|nr:Vesicle trafficking between the ER and Golgi [Recurvomyces mirabilis]KAK5161470.1 Vesicle trafficking between the ER and Golgi [Recurvomyces mirabilis]